MVIVYKNDMVLLRFVTIISQIAGVPLAYEELDEIRARLGAVAPHLVRYGDVEPANFFALAHKLVKVRGTTFCSLSACTWACFCVLNTCEEDGVKCKMGHF